MSPGLISCEAVFKQKKSDKGCTNTDDKSQKNQSIDCLLKKGSSTTRPTLKVKDISNHTSVLFLHVNLDKHK